MDATVEEAVPWSTQGYYLSLRPSFTLDPIFHAGAYYVQEASSMFLEQVLKQTIDLSSPIKVLDLCAAPGGKSTLIQSLLGNKSLLVSNEVIKTRVNILAANITKWGAANVMVTNNDPKDVGDCGFTQSTTANTATITSRAPACLRALAHSLAVVPVVRTSSAKRTILPRTLPGRVTRNALLRFVVRSSRGRLD